MSGTMPTSSRNLKKQLPKTCSTSKSNSKQHLFFCIWDDVLYYERDDVGIVPYRVLR